MINLSSGLFGLSVIGYEEPTFGQFFNIDEKAARMQQLIKQRRKSPYTPGHAAEFISIGNLFGYTFSGSSSLSGPTSVSAGTITATGAVIDWADYSGATSYNYIVTSGGAVVQSGSVAVSTKTLTGLTTATDYVVQVQAVAANGTLTNWSSVSFTTA